MSTVAIELMPGDVALGRAGDQLKTLLGSCVSVILTDPRRTVGAMCHIVHVGKPNAVNADNTAYGEVAFKAMFDKLTGIGVSPSMCHAYIYGGGNMFPDLSTLRHVGVRNIEWTVDYLASKNIPVVNKSLGGKVYRVISWTVGPAVPLVQTTSTEQAVSHGR